jgi:hypothetical protein
MCTPTRSYYVAPVFSDTNQNRYIADLAEHTGLSFRQVVCLTCQRPSEMF